MVADDGSAAGKRAAAGYAPSTLAEQQASSALPLGSARPPSVLLELWDTDVNAGGAPLASAKLEGSSLAGQSGALEGVALAAADGEAIALTLKYTLELDASRKPAAPSAEVCREVMPNGMVLVLYEDGSRKALLRDVKNRTGFSHVYKEKKSLKNPYKVDVSRGGKTVLLGHFATPEEACLEDRTLDEQVEQNHLLLTRSNPSVRHRRRCAMLALPRAGRWRSGRSRQQPRRRRRRREQRSRWRLRRTAARRRGSGASGRTRRRGRRRRRHGPVPGRAAMDVASGAGSPRARSVRRRPHPIN